MSIKIGTYGSGLSAILGAGAIILAIPNNPAWKTLLTWAVITFIISIILRKLKF